MALKNPPRRLVFIDVDLCHFCGSHSDTVRQQYLLGDYYSGWSFCSDCEDKVIDTNKFWEEVYKNMSVGSFGYSNLDEIKIERANGSINLGKISKYELAPSQSSDTFKICVNFKEGKELMNKTISFSQFLKHNPPKKTPIMEDMINNFIKYAKVNGFTNKYIDKYKKTLNEISDYF